MSQAGYTPILSYSSATASAVPLAANLSQGELAINTNDGKLFYKDSAGVVQTMASKATGAIGGSTTQIQFNNAGALGGSASLTWSGTVLTSSGFSGPLNGTVGATTPAAGSFTTTTIGTSETLSYGTANGVAYLNGSKVVTSGSALTFDGTNLGVGTASPASKLQVGGSGFFTSRSVPSTGVGTEIYYDGTSAGWIGYNRTTSAYIPSTFDSSQYIWNTSGSEQMRLTSTGLGIGTSSPTYKLDVNRGSSGVVARFTGGGAASFIYADSSQVYYGSAAGVPNCMVLNEGSNYLTFNTNGSERLRLDSSGNLGLGVTPSNWQSTSGSRAIQFTGSAVYGYRDTNLIFLQNAYYDGAYKYYASSIAAGYYAIASGVHSWSNAASGTAGNAITYTQAMTLDASGNLVLGTTSSLSAQAGRTDVTVNGSSTAIVGLGIGGVRQGYFYAPSTGIILASETGALNLQTTAAQPIIFNTNGSERARIDSSGNVGIGTSSPSQKLAVSSADASGTAVNIINTSTGGYSWNIFSVGSAASLGPVGSLVFRDSTNGATRALIDSSGNLLVGTTTANANFYVYGAPVSYAGLNATAIFSSSASQSTGTGGLLAFEGKYTSGGALANFAAIGGLKENSTDNNYSGYLGFYTRSNGSLPAERARIDSSGNLLVGTTSASSPTSGIVITPSFSAANASGIGISHPSGTSSGAVYSFFFYNGSGIGSITQSGTTAVLYNVTSDQRLKENIVDAPEFGSVIDSIKVRSYDWKTDNTHQRAGFIAQELVTVAPEAVHQPADPEEMMAVDYSKLVPMLVKEIQDLRKRLAAAGI